MQYLWHFILFRTDNKHYLNENKWDYPTFKKQQYLYLLHWG